MRDQNGEIIRYSADRKSPYERTSDWLPTKVDFEIELDTGIMDTGVQINPSIGNIDIPVTGLLDNLNFKCVDVKIDGELVPDKVSELINSFKHEMETREAELKK